ncbi:MAG: DUF1178 family protein [Aquabacterium sp.]|jgi:hypothetical protein|uniref:DUF1178 family protein n=1 Tax=Aquabacterium sp. TaxID=1872578 RepID=UPI002A35BFE8|nr:DUF1178 family protein [Aquabacterium sp.]MDX9844732.1 DUF1178 family protein [Aquabacterium sp.]
MLVVDLHCAHGHHFEGWFASSDDLASQQARGLVTCPVCGDQEVVRRPSAPRLNVSHLKSEDLPPAGRRARAHPVAPDVAAPVSGAGGVPATRAGGDEASQNAEAALQALQAAYLQVVRHVVTQTEDVGERFAEEARSIHHGDAPERPIRGQTSPEEREALREEGIEVLSLPIPEGLKGPLQ